MMRVVYFLRAKNGAVKIGRSSDLATRRKVIERQRGEKLELLAAVPGDAALETRLHKEFAGDRIQGEWFNCTPAVLARIADLTKVASAKAMPDLLFTHAWRERHDAQTFLAMLAEKIVQDRLASASRLALLRTLGTATGVSGEFIRHLIANPSSVRADADFMLRLVEFYEAHCVDEAVKAEQKARDLRQECLTVREWSDCFAQPVQNPPVVASVVDEN